ncbi:MAG: hypothetical protein DRN55_01325 [Thermoplasmata archaeon]|nr:MAG: hypothetical protein DRN55_01325 [Thermoplasmata archaeon]
MGEWDVRRLAFISGRESSASFSNDPIFPTTITGTSFVKVFPGGLAFTFALMKIPLISMRKVTAIAFFFLITSPQQAIIEF